MRLEKKKKSPNLRSKKKKKPFAAEGSEAKKFNSTPKSSGEMVIFEEKNSTTSETLKKLHPSEE